MLQTVDPKLYDLVAVQEPALNRLGQTFASPSWRVIYPEKHATTPKETRALLLINKNIKTDSYTEVKIDSQDTVAIRMQTECGDIEVYNIYLDRSHSRML